MAIEYNLDVRTNLTREVLADILILNQSETFKKGVQAEIVRLSAKDVLVMYISSPADPSSPTFIQVWTSLRGIVPNVFVTFRFPNNTGGKRTHISMLKTVVNVLEQTSDDVVFYHHDNMLRRQAGKVVLQSKAAFWTEDRLALITVPYTFGELN